MLIIWRRLHAWVLIFVVIASGSEFSQAVRVVPGTFDWNDITFYLLGFVLPLIGFKYAKHCLSVITLLVMVVLAVGSSDTGSTGTSSQLPSKTSTSSDNSESSLSSVTTVAANTGVDKLLATRQQEYESRLRSWKAANEALAAAESELLRIENEFAILAERKPTAPEFSLREWSSIDGNYKVTAMLVETDNTTATLRKDNGSRVKLPKKKLTDEDKVYIETAFTNISDYTQQFAAWTEQSSTLDEKRGDEEKTIATAKEPEPQPPVRDAVAAEFMAMNAKKQKEQIAAKAEADRKAAAAAAARAEEELDANGLVLMRKSVSGKTGEFGGTISGIVENHRSRKLSYAQITFNLYDESGAQVGSAMANINGLEPGGKWKFEAVSFGTDFATYKFSDLTGF